jgi:hypothetical protein
MAEVKPMNGNLEALFNVPAKPPRSKLEPYLDLIRDLRSKRWSYRGISELFESELDLSVAPSTLHNFVRVRAAGKTVFAIPAASQALSSPIDAIRSSPAQGGNRNQRFEFTAGEVLRLSPRGGENHDRANTEARDSGDGR